MTGQTPDQSIGQATSVEAVLHCKNHPDRETLLRCNKCGEPICLDCAVLTDVGYRCKQCIRAVQDIYYNAKPQDNWIALVVSFFVAAIALPILGFFLGFFGFFFGLIIAFLMGSGAGASLAQLIRMAVGKRRGRNLRYFAMAGTIAGILVAILFLGAGVLNLPTLVFTALALTTAYPFLR